MINQDSIAAATIAQIFGSELKRVDEYTTQQSNMAGPAVRLDPKRILAGNSNNINNNMTSEQQRIMDAVNAEAAASYPRYDEPPQQEEQPVQLPPVLKQVINPIGIQSTPLQQSAVDQNQMEFSFPPPGSPGFILFEKINSNLERIAKAIERVESSSKKTTKP